MDTTIRAGSANGQKLDIVSAFQSYGQYLSHDIDESQDRAIVEHSCPGAGACGGMYTANTMASNALGGSTNAVLHLIAMARSVNVSLGIDDFQRVSDRTPLLADFKPSGPYVMEDLHNAGGIPAVVKVLLEAGLLHGDCMTVTGKTLPENVHDLPGLSAGQKIVQPLATPLKMTGHIQILKGNLAPEGAVAKITGKEGLRFAGPANVFDSEEEMLHALERGEIKKGEVIVIRYEGPKGGPGMPEMLTPTSAIVGAGLGKEVALITDGRFSVAHMDSSSLM